MNKPACSTGHGADCRPPSEGAGNSPHRAAHPTRSRKRNTPAKILAGLPSFARLRGIVPCSPAETGGRKMKKQFEVASLPALFILSSFYHSEKA
jgi:hypothetical protein